MSLPAHDTAADTDQAFLGVTKSATGRRWLARQTDRRLAAALCQRFGVSDLIGGAMAARGVDLDSADAFLEPKLCSLLPDQIGDPETLAEGGGQPTIGRAREPAPSGGAFGDAQKSLVRVRCRVVGRQAHAKPP